MSGWGLREVSVWHERELALDRVSLQARPGQVTAVVGGDGAGKTTLLRCLAGAQAPGTGHVSTPGVRQIGYLPSSSGVYPDLTVAENLAFRAAAYGLAGPAAREQAQEYLDRAGLAAARDRLGGELSGGMRQKLGMIMAMVHRPQLLVLDEPTTGVDPVSRSDLWWLIARAAAGGAAVVLATTYLDEAERSAAVLALDGGRELAQGTPEEIIAALPGTLRAVDARPDGQDSRRAWRRGGQWRVWDPPAADRPVNSPDPAGSRIRAGHPANSPDLAGSRVRAGHPANSPDLAGSRIRASRPPAGQLDGVIQPDLQDAVTIAALARELRAAGRTT